MKRICLLFAFTAFMLVKAISAQTNIQVSGHLTDISTSTPVPNHYVSVFVHPYSLGVAPYYADSVLTNSAGYYSFNFMLPTPVDSLFVLKVGTFECNGNWAHETFDNTNGQTNFSSDLFICDSIYQNLNCHGAIEWPGYQNLTVTLHGYGWPDPDFYNWDLGDGTYATGQNVIHTYSTHQRYTIGLTTTNFPDSCTHSSIATVDLSTTSDCESSFSYSRQDQFTVNFQGSTNSQYPTQFSWDFGDGTSGSSQIVSHTYATIGSYNAVLITLDSIGCSYTYSQIINIYDCSHSISLWNSGFEVGLHGYMSNNQSAEFLWDLGDGFTSTDQWLYHMYTLPGTYNISLQTITADNCVFISDTIITVPYGCDSWLIVGTGSNVFEQSFQGFIANNYPTEFLWEFGDGDSGSGQNITHIYPAYGTYFCSLTTIDSTGCTDVNYMPIIITSDTTNQGFCDNNIYIFNETGYTYGVHGYMTDNYDASYLWDMGDGSTYDLSFFYHTYPGPGIYNVMLQTITEDSCIDINYTTVHVLDSIPNDCSSYFSATATNNLYEIHFEGSTTSPYPATFLWNFGDPASGANNSSTLQNPNHTFSAAGTYSVTLTIVDSTNCTSIFSAPVILSLFSNYSLFGQVLAGNQSITDCKVQLFSQDYTGSMNMIEEVTPDSANYYKFDSVSSGIYHILAIPDPGTIYALQYLPTYFGDAFLWENSIPVVLGQPANPYPIHLVDFDSISGGDGMITGGLTAGGKSINVGNQEILILDINNIPVKYLFSEPDGTFSFAGLPYGEYKVYPVITGIKTYPVTVILSATNTSANVIMKISGQTVAGTGESEHYNIIENLYPNPASDVIAVSFKVKGMFRLQIIDASGKAVYIISEAIPTDGNDISIPISALKPGLYLLVVQDAAGNNTTRRFIKK